MSEEVLEEEPDVCGPIAKEDQLSSGSTLLNLAASGNPDWALAKGRYFWVVGDSDSGKTWLMLTILAEASINPNFKNYDFIYDDVEGGALMDKERYFGSALADRIEAPQHKDGEAVNSSTVESFYFEIDNRINKVKKGEARPFIWVLDSMDALETKYAAAKFEERKTEYEGGRRATGDYGDGKAKINSTHIRRVISGLRDTGSILLIISQTRDDIDTGGSTHAGGRALKFYASYQMWTSPGALLTKSVNDQDRQIGITSRIHIRKNRVSGKEWKVEIPIYHSHGIDDIGSCVDFLIKEKHWKQDGRIDSDFGKFFKEPLVQKIENEGLEVELRALVLKVWNDIEEKCTVKRKNKYQV